MAGIATATLVIRLLV